MPAIQGYSIKHVAGKAITVGPGTAVTATGSTISNPNDITIDIDTDNAGAVSPNSMLAVYVIQDGGNTFGKASADFFWTPSSGKYRRVGAVRVVPDGNLAEAFQSDSGQIRPTHYTDPGNDTKFTVTKSTTFKPVDLSAYATKGGDVVLAITVSSPTSEVEVKSANGTVHLVIGGGVLQLRTNPHGEAEFKPMHEDVKLTVLSFIDAV